jgi:lysozyme
MRYSDRDWQFWQYQADGIVPGIDGEVDRNAFYGDLKQWQAFLDGPRPATQEAAAPAAPATVAQSTAQATLAPPQMIGAAGQADPN